MAGWKLRKDKNPAEISDGEAPSTEEAASTEAPSAEAPSMDSDADRPARTYDLSGQEETNEPAFLNSVPDFSSFASEPEAHFTDLDFDSELEDPKEVSKNEQAGTEHFEHSDGPLTLVDYTEPEAMPMPQEFSSHGAQIFEMPPPAIEMPLPVVEAPSSAIEAAPPVSGASPFAMAVPPAVEVPPPAEEEDFPAHLRTGRFDRSELAPAPDHSFGGIPAVSPFVPDTPPAAVPPAAPPQLVVRVGRLSAPFALAKDVTTIGRPDGALHYYPDVEIDLDDAVSRRHAEVVKRGDSYYLVDTGSTNGTRLNGEKLPPQEERLLAYGDRIRLGDRTEITFE